MEIKSNGYRMGAHELWFDEAAVPKPRDAGGDSNLVDFIEWLDGQLSLGYLPSSKASI